MKKIIPAISTIAYFGIPSLALAANQADIGNVCNGLTGQFNILCIGSGNAGTVLGAIVNLLFLIAALIALFYLVQGGIRWITSGGDSKQVEGARGQIIAAAVGLAITFLSYLLLNLLLTFFLSTNIGNLQIPTLRGTVSPGA